MHEYKYPSQFLTDVTTAAGLLEHGRQSKALAKRIADEAFRLRSNPEAADALFAKDAEIARLREDADRYRYLEPWFSPMGLNIDGNHAWTWRGSPARLTGPTLDAAIDAARKGTT